MFDDSGIEHIINGNVFTSVVTFNNKTKFVGYMLSLHGKEINIYSPFCAGLIFVGLIFISLGRCTKKQKQEHLKTILFGLSFLVNEIF